MAKKALSIALAVILTLGVLCVPASANLTAAPTASTVLVNGVNVAFDAYLINGNNYFKLRDLAYTLNGTAKQFSVGWDGANNAISLTSGQAYVAVGGEMEGKGSGTKTPTPTTSKIIKDGAEVQFTAYLIDGNNYFKLRDIGAAFDFGVDWDGARNTIVIDTSKGYTTEVTATPATTPSGSIDADLVGAWSSSLNALGSYYSYYSGAYEGVTGNIEGIEFKADGTFGCFRITVGKVTFNGKSRDSIIHSAHKGNYKVENGIIYFTNVMKKLSTYIEGNLESSVSYDFKSVSDHRIKFEFTSWETEKDTIKLEYLDSGVENSISFLYNQRRIAE